MNKLDQMPCVKQGLWFHGGVTTCPVRIVRHHVLYGTGDPDDPPDWAEDSERECFYIRYHLPSGPQPWQDGGAALSLREAVFMAERKLGLWVSWID
jgi:hypothetical protein